MRFYFLLSICLSRKAEPILCLSQIIIYFYFLPRIYSYICLCLHISIHLFTIYFCFWSAFNIYFMFVQYIVHVLKQGVLLNLLKPCSFAGRPFQCAAKMKYEREFFQAAFPFSLKITHSSIYGDVLVLVPWVHTHFSTPSSE